MTKTRLSVNINKVALIRNSRGENLPNIVQFAQDCEAYGADGITVHPRPDERHIRYDDLLPLKEVVTTEFNIEGYPNPKFIDTVCKVVPHQVTLVPDPPGVLTSNEGWDTDRHADFLIKAIKRFKSHSIRVSLFLEADVHAVELAAKTGTDRVEFYTGHYAKNHLNSPKDAVYLHTQAAKKASSLGIGVNAGHDLNLDNLKYYASEVPNLLEVSIGHALISDSLYYGIQNTIGMYQRLLG